MSCKESSFWFMSWKINRNFLSRIKTLYRSGLYLFNYNQEIARIKYLDDLFNISYKESEDIIKYKIDKSSRFIVMSLDNLYFSFILIVFGSIITFLSLFIEIISINKGTIIINKKQIYWKQFGKGRCRIEIKFNL